MTWIGGSADWNTPGDWSTGATPGTSDDAVLGGTATYTVSLSTSISVHSISIADSHATLQIANPGGTEATTGNVSNSGILVVDQSGQGGSTLSIGGTLSNTFTIVIGNTALATAAAVTAAALDNIGSISLIGSGAAQASLDIAGSAPATWTGSATLSGDALLQFGGGQIGTINGPFSITGPNARVADLGSLGNNSALTGLTRNAWSLRIADRVTLGLSGDFANDGILVIDDGAAAGSSLTVAGTLTNRDLILIDGNASQSSSLAAAALTNSSMVSFGENAAVSIGGAITNSGTITVGGNGIAAPASVSAGALSNTGTLDIVGGGSVQAALQVAGAAPGTWTGSVTLSGDSLLKFGSGEINTIAAGAMLELDGSGARVAVASNPGGNSALAGLSVNAGGYLLLEDGASVTTSAGLDFTNQFVAPPPRSARSPVKVGVDDTGGGGSSLSFGGILNNAGNLVIGNTQISAPTIVTAAGLFNSGFLGLMGTNLVPVTLDIEAAAPSTWTGDGSVQFDALIEFSSGGITAIGTGASLLLDGPTARIALASAPTSNSALVGLASNAGSLRLFNGGTIATAATPDFANGGFMELAGSTLSIGGSISNSGNLSIEQGATVNTGGTYYQTAGRTTVTSGNLNAGLINITGGYTFFNAALANSAPIDLSGSGTIVEFYDAATNGVTVNFTAPSGTIALDAPGKFAGTIGDLNVGSSTTTPTNQIDLPGTQIGSIKSASLDSTSDLLTVALTDNSTFTIRLSGSFGSNTAVNKITDSNGSGADLFLSAPRQATHDFNRDGRADIALQNDIRGQTWVWEMNGNAIIGSGNVARPDPGWKVKGIGDVNGDGTADIVLQNDSTGQTWVWEMNGNAIVGGGNIATPDPGWKVKATGDLNDDGNADIVLQNADTGQVYAWEMNGNAIIGGGSVTRPDPGWQVRATGDVNGDGLADIILQNDNTRQIYIWEMNGNAIIGQGGNRVVDPGWHVVATGDFTGDGKADILYQNDTTGEVGIDEMNGTAFVRFDEIGVPDPGWRVKAAADFTGHGGPDILLQNDSSGQTWVWGMTGTAITGGGNVGTPDPGWHIPVA